MKIHSIEEKSVLKVCQEAPVELIVNENKLLTFMCTPINLNELAVGYLLSSGAIDSLEDIYTLGACDDMREMFITLGREVNLGLQLNTVLASSCGSGSLFTEDLYKRPKNNSPFKICIDTVKALSIEMLSKAELYKNHGGVHCAAIVYEGELIALREDVGRHNAVDKAIGRAVFYGAAFENSIIISTGRISTDMILKAINIGVPIVATRSIPTSLALEVAENMGITIIGRIMSINPVVYSHRHRVQSE